MKLKNWLQLEKEDLDRRIRNYSKFRLMILFSVIVGLLVSLFWLWQKTASIQIKQFDLAVFDFFLNFKTLFLIKFFSVITLLGSTYLIVLNFLILAWILISKRRKRAAAITLFALMGSVILTHFLRNTFERPRPYGCLATLLGSSCYSFPSGHSTISIYFYGLLLYLIFRFLPISLKKFFWFSLGVSILVILIGISRIFLGVHYPSDILAGFFLGGSWLLLAILLIDILY